MFQTQRLILPVILALFAGSLLTFAQTPEDKPNTDVPAAADKAAKPAKTPKPDDKTKNTALDPSKLTAEQVAESAILVYGGSILGRQTMNQIRKTATERGTLIITASNGKSETATYERWTLRGDNLDKERVRLDQSFPDAKYSLVYAGEKIFGVYNDKVFAPREDASAAFKSQIWHGLDGLLRYKENESTLELAGREKIMGVDYFLLDVTDKGKRKTRYFVSLKSYRVMFLDYEEEGVKYRRKFYDYRYAQGTLVPYRSVLMTNDKEIEETRIGTITFGQRVGEDIFKDS